MYSTEVSKAVDEEHEMTEMEPRFHEILLDQEFNRAIDQLRKKAHETFLRDICEVRQLSEMLVSWNEELLKELDDAVARYEALRSQLSEKMLAASTVAAHDMSRVRDTTNRMAQESQSIEQFYQHLNSERGRDDAGRRRVA